MELLIVIVILGLLASVVLPSLTGKSEEAKRKLTCVQMKNVHEALKMFKIDNGRYPNTEESLQALINNPAPESFLSYSTSGYLEDKKIPKDAWGHNYIYIYNEESGIDIISFASDGKEGGNKDNLDIYLSKCK
jgi:general secretion pathway protein G